jgi:hypothetical protein
VASFVASDMMSTYVDRRKVSTQVDVRDHRTQMWHRAGWS